MSPAPHPLLLADAGYYGTLAAARTLGREGVPVTVIDPSRVAPALWSRHVTRRVRCPPFADVERVTEWLARFGETSPGHVVLPTSDDVSFALATHREELSKHMVIGQPDLTSLIRILDKGRLLDDARAVGLDVPDTWLPQSQADVDRVVHEARGPLVVKPRTQVLLATHGKGAIVDGPPSEMAAAYAHFRHRNRYAPAFASRFPEATWPMLQRYHAQAMDGIYSLAGFRARVGEGFAVLAANKVLQRPRRLGIGLCFEEAPVDPDLAERVKKLCERVGYFGIFEVEFIREGEGERSLLIDMNGRLYNQVAFDVARGLPLPQLAYAEALDRRDEVARLLEGAQPVLRGSARGFCNRFGLEVLVAAKRVTGRMSQDDARRWRAWCDERDGGLVDAVADRDDLGPLAFEVAAQLYGYLRHPFSFVRTIALDG
jgi:predicted ATP-grasp superfamily ATP-dependent carboligase